MSTRKKWCFLVLLLLSTVIAVNLFSGNDKKETYYNVLCDFGSSGSRVYLMKTESNPYDVSLYPQGNPFLQKVKPGLSSLLPSTDLALESVLPAIQNAVDTLEFELGDLSSTKIILQGYATAGLRVMAQENGYVLEDDDELDINDLIEEDDDSMMEYSLTKSLLELRNMILDEIPVLKSPKNEFRIISGSEEGIYGWITLQSLVSHGFHTFKSSSTNESLDNILNPMTSSSSIEPFKVGGMDFGGASTQISYWVPDNMEYIGQSNDYHHPSPYVYTPGGKVYVHSYLRYGIYQSRYRTIDKIMDANNNIHPCLLEGSIGEHYNDPNIKFQGSSNYHGCMQLIRSLFDWSKCENEACSFDGVHMPPVSDSSYVFIGFDYATVIASHFGFVGTTILSELEQRVQEYCSMTMEDARKDLEEYPERTPITEERLLWRCFEGAYMVVLFREGYHFKDAAPHLVFTRELSGETISWALGSVISSGNL